MMDFVMLGITGPWEIILIVLALLLLFGGRKIPEIMKGFGKGIREFKDATGGNKGENKDSDSLNEGNKSE
ncbi:MAG: twin-arginine translocase TatA/TatE family subunit [Bacteroidales bacterium]|nr:twin-arginine translocase TatA/TatE family subunit [Bacteroidales bacterium]